MGRWSCQAAREIVTWRAAPPSARWVDVGCGTGALTQVILDDALSQSMLGVDASEDYLTLAREHVGDERTSFLKADAQNLPVEPAAFDIAVSGLMLNFAPDPALVLGQMIRAARVGGMVACYVWDYAVGMGMLQYFWETAVALDPPAISLDEGRRFPLCEPEPLRQLFESAHLSDVHVRSIETTTTFRDFDDYWTPFLGGQGPAPSYLASLPEKRRVALRERLRATLPIAADGSLRLTARAWAARGVR